MVIHIDRFGNVVTNIGEELFQERDRAQIVVQARGAKVRGIKNAYAAVERGQLLALIGSNGRLELAIREGSAAVRLGLSEGDTVHVSLDID
jgi:S-adenosylmethionine hydrolase